MISTGQRCARRPGPPPSCRLAVGPARRGQAAASSAGQGSPCGAPASRPRRRWPATRTPTPSAKRAHGAVQRAAQPQPDAEGHRRQHEAGQRRRRPAWCGNGPTAPACPQGWCTPWPSANSHCGSASPPTDCTPGLRQRTITPPASVKPGAALHRAHQAVRAASSAGRRRCRRCRPASSCPSPGRRRRRATGPARRCRRRTSRPGSEQPAVGAEVSSAQATKPGCRRCAPAAAAAARPGGVGAGGWRGLGHRQATKASASAPTRHRHQRARQPPRPPPRRPAPGWRWPAGPGRTCPGHHLRAFLAARTGRAAWRGSTPPRRPCPAPCSARQAPAARCCRPAPRPAGQRVQRQPAQQHRPPPEAVGHRAPHQLAQAEGQDQRRHRQLRRRHRRAQLACQLRQRRQVQVGGDGLQAQQQGQHHGAKPMSGPLRPLGARAPSARGPCRAGSGSATVSGRRWGGGGRRPFGGPPPGPSEALVGPR
jgi:hypothetical protein